MLSNVHRYSNKVLALAAVGFMVLGAFYPIYGERPGRALQSLAVIAIAAVMTGAWFVPQGSQSTFFLLWAAFGMAAAIGTISIFSVGFTFLIAAVTILLSIFTTPNRSSIELRYDWRFIAAFFIGYLAMFFLGAMLASRF